MEGTNEHGTDCGTQPTQLQRSLTVFVVGLLLQAVIVGLAWYGKVQAGSSGSGTINVTISAPPTIEVTQSGPTTANIEVQLSTDTPMTAPVEWRYVGESQATGLLFVANSLNASANTTCGSKPSPSNIIDVTCSDTNLVGYAEHFSDSRIT